MFQVYADGTGYNLKPVVDGDKFVEAITIQNLTFFYHPCGDTTSLPNNFPGINETDNECKQGYSLCMYNITLQKAVVLGKASQMNFRKNGDNMQVLFVKPSEEKVASVTLECTPKGKTSVLYAPLEKIDQVVRMTLSIKFHV